MSQLLIDMIKNFLRSGHRMTMEQLQEIFYFNEDHDAITRKLREIEEKDTDEG